MRQGPRWFTGSADALFQNMNLLDDMRPEHVIVFGADHIYRLDPRQMLDFHRRAGRRRDRRRHPRAGRGGVPVRRDREGGRQHHDRARSTRRTPMHPVSPTHLTRSSPRWATTSSTPRSSAAGHDRRMRRTTTPSTTSAATSSPSWSARAAPTCTTTRPTSCQVRPSREDHYWRDVGTLDSYFDAHMDLVARLPAFDLYNDDWPIFTRTLTEPPAKISDGDSGPSRIANSHPARAASSCPAAAVSNSVLSGGVTVTRCRGRRGRC